MTGVISTQESGGDLVVEWSIADFCTLRTEDGECYLSPLFSFGGSSCYLLIYPNGRSLFRSSGHVGLSLSKLSDGPSIGYSFSLSLKTAEGKRHGEVHLTRKFHVVDGLYNIHRFIPRSDLLRKESDLLPDGVLTVVCTIKSSKWNWPFLKWKRKEIVTVSKAAPAVSSIEPTEERDWVTDVSEFLKEGRGSDVTFEVETLSEKAEVIAHQLILAMRSPYFADEFYGKARASGYLRISLKGIDPKAFEQMIRYCYDDKPCLKTIEEACALLKVAFDFGVMNLQTLCCTFIREAKIDPKTVFTVLEVSEQIEDKSLEEMCCKILQEKTRDVMAAYELHNVTPAMVRTFFNLPNLFLSSEYELIKWTLDWAKVKSENEDSSDKNCRDYLEWLLKDMDFLSLKMEEFASLCRDNPQFFSSDEIASIFLNIAHPGTREMPPWYDGNVKCRVFSGLRK